MRIQHFDICLLAVLALATVGLQAQTVSPVLVRPVVMPIEANGLTAIALDGWFVPLILSQNGVPAEAAPYAQVKIDGRTALHLDEINSFPHPPAGPTEDDVYRKTPHRFYKLDVVDQHQPFTLTVRARLTAYDYLRAGTGRYAVARDSSKGFCFLASTGTEEYGFCLTLAYSEVLNENTTQNYPSALYFVGNTTMPSTTTDDKFHTYQIDVTPGIGSKLYRDGKFLGSGTNTGSWHGQLTALNKPARSGLYLGNAAPTGGLPVGDITDFWYVPHSAIAVIGAQPAQ